MRLPRRVDKSSPPRKALDPVELDRLWRWQWRMYAFYGIAVTLIAGAFVLIGKYPDERWLRIAAVGMIGALMVAGSFVQFRERCPRCGTRIGRQARLLLPEVCAVCGVGFPKRPEAAG